MHWRRKPAGWPAYLVSKRLSRGSLGYYWQPPSWARESGCPLHSEALGTDFVRAKAKCDEILNPQFEAWRKGNSFVNGPLSGTFDWLRVPAATMTESSRWSLSTNSKTVVHSANCRSKPLHLAQQTEYMRSF